MKKYFYTLLTCGLLITVEAFAQTKPASLHVDLVRESEEENLNVFQQWIRWNNPGSLLIDHLTKQALQYYDVRDVEIAKLTTRNGWIARQKSVKNNAAHRIAPPFRQLFGLMLPVCACCPR